MNQLSTNQSNLRKDIRGANLVEYVILCGVIALFALAGFKQFGGNLNNKINSQAGTLQGIGN